MKFPWMPAIAALLCAGSADAAPCSDLADPVYVSSGSVSQPVLRALSPVLAAGTGADHMTLVYVFTQTCDTLLRFTSGAALTGTGVTYAADGTATSCDVPEGTHADLGIGNLFAPSCVSVSPTVDPSVVSDAPYVVSPTVFVVPVASDQVAISAEEAYFVYGFGAAGMVMPWTDEHFIYRRTATAGTQVVIAQNINVPAARFLGIDGVSVQNLLTLVAAAPTPRTAVGFLSAADADAHRSAVRRLAFRAYGQQSFYWPDSTHASFDRRNVRDGHYQVWNYEHVYVPVAAPADGRARRLGDMLTGVRPLPTGDMTSVAIGLGFVPRCAMSVQRTADDDGTSLASYDPPAPCGCSFEAAVPMGTTTCHACTTVADCGGTGACRRGYCEAR